MKSQKLSQSAKKFYAEKQVSNSNNLSAKEEENLHTQVESDYAEWLAYSPAASGYYPSDRSSAQTPVSTVSDNDQRPKRLAAVKASLAISALFSKRVKVPELKITRNVITSRTYNYKA